MGFIYKITNQINQQLYIGKTTLSIEKRWAEHCRAYDNIHKRTYNCPLYRAMRKYGMEHFIIEEVEICDDNILNEREQYWIKYYNTYKNGYNGTLGGEGTLRINRDEVIAHFKALHSVAKTARTCKCSRDMVRWILKNYIPDYSTTIYRYNIKTVVQYDKQGHKIQAFNSSYEAAQYLLDKGIAKGKINSVSNKIRGCCTQEAYRKTAYGYKWKFAE